MNRRIASALAITGLLTVTAASAWAADPLAPFAGNWSGSGKIIVSNGSNERIRCRANNSAKTAALAVNIRCASDSYKFELSSDITSDAGGNLSGSWNEATHNVFGQLNGRISAGTIQATATAIAFSATLTMRVAGGTQNVSIRAPGQEIQEVVITLAKGGQQ